MEIFVSWSGARSHAVAKALHDWLPMVINDLQPWFSSVDIGKGTRWSVDVAKRLSTARAGIICLTPDNLHADWIHFEAGALSKAIENSKLCTFLVGLEPSDLEPPLSQFQATKAEEADVLKMLCTLNQELGERALPQERVAKNFAVCWHKLKEELDLLPADKSLTRPMRSQQQLLEEILDLVRNQNRPVVGSLTDEDRVSVIAARASKVIFKSGTAASVISRNEGPVIGIDVEAVAGGRYAVTIPKGIPIEEIEKHVQAQIPADKETPPPAVDKIAGP
jgi:hypothetical protein